MQVCGMCTNWEMLGILQIILICLNNALLQISSESRYPPTSVVKLLIDANRRAIDWPDEHGWLPLHYACHHGISGEVLELLFSSNPEAVKVVDKKGRNPLHFAVGNIGKKAGIFKSNLFTSLAGSGAVKVADSKGMIVSKCTKWF